MIEGHQQSPAEQDEHTQFLPAASQEKAGGACGENENKHNDVLGQECFFYSFLLHNLPMSLLARNPRSSTISVAGS